MRKIKQPTKEQIAQVEELSKIMPRYEILKTMNLWPCLFNDLRRASPAFDEAYLRGANSNPRLMPFNKPKPIVLDIVRRHKSPPMTSKILLFRKPKKIVHNDVLSEEEMMKLAMLVVNMPVTKAIEKTPELSQKRYNKARKNQPHLVYTIDVANAYRLKKTNAS